LRLPLLEPILFLVRSVSVDLNVIFALVMENVIGMILSYVTDVKVDLNVSAIFLFLMVIVRNALWLIVRVIHLFVLSVFRSMNVNATLIVIKLTNRDPDK